MALLYNKRNNIQVVVVLNVANDLVTKLEDIIAYVSSRMGRYITLAFYNVCADSDNPSGSIQTSISNLTFAILVKK